MLDVDRLGRSASQARSTFSGESLWKISGDILDKYHNRSKRPHSPSHSLYTCRNGILTGTLLLGLIFLLKKAKARPCQLCVRTMHDKGEWVNVTEAHLCGTGEMSINPLVLLGCSSASHTASCGQQAKTWLLQCGCAHQTRVWWQEADPLLHLSDLHSFIDTNHLHSASTLWHVTGGNAGSGAIHVLMMSSSCSARSRSNNLLSTDAERNRRPALRRLNSGKN